MNRLWFFQVIMGGTLFFGRSHRDTDSPLSDQTDGILICLVISDIEGPSFLKSLLPQNPKNRFPLIPFNGGSDFPNRFTPTESNLS